MKNTLLIMMLVIVVACGGNSGGGKKKSNNRSRNASSIEVGGTVIVPIELTRNSIIILEDVSKKWESEGLSCSVDLQKQTIPYIVQGEVLFLGSESEGLQLELVNGDGQSILGTWKAPSQVEAGVKIETTFIINSNRMLIDVQCNY